MFWATVVDFFQGQKKELPVLIAKKEGIYPLIPLNLTSRDKQLLLFLFLI